MPAQSPVSADDPDLLRRLMTGRYSCRSFQADALPDAAIRAIFDLARHTASWSNVQPWQAIVTRPATTAKVSEALLAEARSQSDFDTDLPYPSEYLGVHLERRREVGYGLYNALGIKRDDRAAREHHRLNNFRFFGAPHVAFLTMPEELGHYGAVDIGAFVGAFMLAAHAHGVATLAQAALAQYSGVIRRMLSIEEGRKFVCGIAFGYAESGHPANEFRATRVQPEEIFRFA